MLRAEAVADRNAHVFEGDLRIFEAMHAEQFFRLAAYDAGAIRLDQDAADTAVPALGLGLGENQDEISDGAERDPRLRAGDHVVVALARRAGGHPGDVGSEIRLGDRSRGEEVAAEDPGDERLLARLAMLVQEQRGLDRQCEGIADAARATGNLFHDDAGRDGVEPAAAGLIRQADAEHPEPGEIPIEFARETILAVDRRSGGQDLRLGKAAHRVA